MLYGFYTVQVMKYWFIYTRVGCGYWVRVYSKVQHFVYKYLSNSDTPDGGTMVYENKICNKKGSHDLIGI